MYKQQHTHTQTWTQTQAHARTHVHTQTQTQETDNHTLLTHTRINAHTEHAVSFTYIPCMTCPITC